MGDNGNIYHEYVTNLWNILIFVIIAIFGGASAYLSDIKHRDQRFSYLHMSVDLVTAGFVGMVCAFILIEMEVAPLWIGAICGICGQMGRRGLRALEYFALKKFSLSDDQIKSVLFQEDEKPKDSSKPTEDKKADKPVSKDEGTDV